MHGRDFPRAMRLIVRLLRPWCMLLTKRDWRGAEHFPDGGFVLAANHVSHTDPLLLSHYLVDHGVPPRFLAKASVFEVPLGGRLVAASGQIPVYRDTADAGSALSAAVDSIAAGVVVVIYPEGTLTRDPHLWPMAGRTGAARVALMTGCPVVPVAQWGPHELLRPYTRRLRLFPRRTIHVHAGPPVDLEDLRGREIDTQVLAEATERILAAITAQLAMIRGQTPPAVRHDPRTAEASAPDERDDAGAA
ncbi:MAG: 1-acyl-sn-glycerol-3-phosphate acyltransferase [Actinomycetota bacterium]|nr:1-acyl-sn-glycerol-3-phosphate acyltransferase [Actinomycetota bacterium]